MGQESSHRVWVALKLEKAREWISCRAVGGPNPANTRDFSLVNHFRFLASRTVENKFALFQATKFMAICYWNNRKLIQYFEYTQILLALKMPCLETSLVVQLLTLMLPMLGSRVRALVRQLDPTRCN